jgi:protease IV
MDSQTVSARPLEQKSHKGLWVMLSIVLVLILCVGSCVGLWALAMMVGNSDSSSITGSDKKIKTDYVAGNEASSDKLLAISISGPILNTRPANALLALTSEVTYGYEVKDLLNKAAKETDIKGVILEIDSPGGTITGSKAVADGVEYYRKQTGKPVYAHIMGMGASGAYWSAASTDYIISDSGSLIGSIGVILGPFKYYKTVLSEGDSTSSITTKDGIDTYYITSGGHKDFGSPERPMTDEERASLQADNDAAYKTFVDFVSSRRKISADTIKNKIQALAFGEQKALDLKLIDKIGSLGEAYAALAGKAGLENDKYQVVRANTTVDFWSMLFSGKLFESLQPGKVQTLDISQELNGKMLYMYDEGKYLK